MLLYYKCKQLKIKPIQRKISPQEKLDRNYNKNNNYAGTGFIDDNPRYNHVRRSRITINENL